MKIDAIFMVLSNISSIFEPKFLFAKFSVNRLDPPHLIPRRVLSNLNPGLIGTFVLLNADALNNFVCGVAVLELLLNHSIRESRPVVVVWCSNRHGVTGCRSQSI